MEALRNPPGSRAAGRQEGPGLGAGAGVAVTDTRTVLMPARGSDGRAGDAVAGPGCGAGSAASRSSAGRHGACSDGRATLAGDWRLNRSPAVVPGGVGRKQPRQRADRRVGAWRGAPVRRVAVMHRAGRSNKSCSASAGSCSPATLQAALVVLWQEGGAPSSAPAARRTDCRCARVAGTPGGHFGNRHSSSRARQSCEGLGGWGGRGRP